MVLEWPHPVCFPKDMMFRVIETRDTFTHVTSFYICIKDLDGLIRSWFALQRKDHPHHRQYYLNVNTQIQSNTFLPSWVILSYIHQLCCHNQYSALSILYYLLLVLQLKLRHQLTSTSQPPSWSTPRTDPGEWLHLLELFNSHDLPTFINIYYLPHFKCPTTIFSMFKPLPMSFAHCLIN